MYLNKVNMTLDAFKLRKTLCALLLIFYYQNILRRNAIHGTYHMHTTLVLVAYCLKIFNGAYEYAYDEAMMIR